MDIGSVAWFIGTVIGTLILGAGIAYAMWQWRTRSQNPAVKREGDRAVERLYEEEDRR